MKKNLIVICMLLVSESALAARKSTYDTNRNARMAAASKAFKEAREAKEGWRDKAIDPKVLYNDKIKDRFTLVDGHLVPCERFNGLRIRQALSDTLVLCMLPTPRRSPLYGNRDSLVVVVPSTSQMAVGDLLQDYADCYLVKDKYCKFRDLMKICYAPQYKLATPVTYEQFSALVTNGYQLVGD